MNHVSRLLLLGCASVVVNAHASGQTTVQERVCAQQPGAAARRVVFEQGMTPSVVFEGETQPQPLGQRMAEQRVPGLGVAVIRAGQLDWSAVYGVRAAGKPAVSCATLFQAGSLAKPVTVFAALRLADAGRLDWDRDVDALLRSVRLPAGKQSAEHPVTLRHLFAHTAGITPGGYPGYAQGGPVPSPVDIASGAAGANTPRAEVVDRPGANLRYSGGGYTLAQIALQDTQGLAFEPLMRRWLFQPVKLSAATFALQQATARGDIAEGHAGDGSPVPGGWLHLPESAAAGLWSSASDLAQLLTEVWKGYHGRSAVFQQASMRALLDATPVYGHVYGFRLMGEGDARFLVHYGGTTGYNAGMVLNLRTGDGAVYLANGEGGRGLGGEVLASLARAYGWSQFQETRVRRAAVEAAAVEGLGGRYAFGASGPRVVVERAQAELTLVFPNGDRYVLTPIAAPEPLQFIHAGSGVRAGFMRGADGAVTLQLYGQQGVREPDAKP
ncbi:serine hydrolase domain-containing protein [Roseateles asaccharophilus]|uniref:CubicO group peptidase (Beta-lactamase class C family) n=1 Tax=Roseateles asaccharophilus TaxID=582607 RepID=A0ABU2ABS6_9BURK|nr:serine hydrolase domain-containing protein [Roseateles asaccharophilus]MDR7334460.1 CubicO group peptidase (beta-lactamase class C family) [Roseateles asaccharophilus]